MVLLLLAGAQTAKLILLLGFLHHNMHRAAVPLHMANMQACTPSIPLSSPSCMCSSCGGACPPQLLTTPQLHCRSCNSPGSAVLLPLGLWTSAVLSPQNMHVDVGVVLEDGTMHTASRQYQEGKLTRVCIHTLERA